MAPSTKITRDALKTWKASLDQVKTCLKNVSINHHIKTTITKLLASAIDYHHNVSQMIDLITQDVQTFNESCPYCEGNEKTKKEEKEEEEEDEEKTKKEEDEDDTWPFLYVMAPDHNSRNEFEQMIVKAAHELYGRKEFYAWCGEGNRLSFDIYYLDKDLKTAMDKAKNICFRALELFFHAKKEFDDDSFYLGEIPLLHEPSDYLFSFGLLHGMADCFDYVKEYDHKVQSQVCQQGWLYGHNLFIKHVLNKEPLQLSSFK